MPTATSAVPGLGRPAETWCQTGPWPDAHILPRAAGLAHFLSLVGEASRLGAFATDLGALLHWLPRGLNACDAGSKFLSVKNGSAAVTPSVERASAKATKRKRGSASDKAPSSASPHASAQAELARLTRELTDERRQRMATSEVLRLLSGSHGDLNHLFDTVLANATNLCEANFGTLSLCEGDAFRIVAMHNVPPGLAKLRRREPLVRAGPLLRMAETKRLLHIADYTEYVASHPADSDAAAFAKLTGVRTILEVPMLKDDDVVGAIVIYRKEVRRFDDREIALIKDFAAQAVIAIENARLLNELRQRTDDLSEALEQQTATSDVLKVIANTQGELEPVFNAILENATRICEAELGTLVICENDGFRHVAGLGLPPDYVELRKREPVLRPP